MFLSIPFSRTLFIFPRRSAVSDRPSDAQKRIQLDIHTQNIALNWRELARIHRRYDVTAAEWAIGAREGDGAGTISGKWGQCLSSAAAGRPCDRLGTLGRARWRGEDAARDSRGAGWRELAGTFGCPLGGSGTGVAVRQEVESLAVGPGRG